MGVKQEITKILESLPESVLPDVLNFMKDLESASRDGERTALNLRRILKEDHELLQELAK